MDKTKHTVELDNIDFKEALKYLGYRKMTPDESMKELLLTCEKELIQSARPSFVYQVHDYSDGIIKGSAFELEGKTIVNHLAECDKVIMLCATLSSGVDALIRRKQIGKMAEAALIDSLASYAVDMVCDKALSMIKEDYPGYEMTYRYGIGYGDFPLPKQQEFLDALNAGRLLGVSTSASHMLIPTKTVTCIIGMGKNIPDNKK